MCVEVVVPLIYGYNPAFLLAIVLVFFFHRVIYSTRLFYSFPGYLPLRIECFLASWQSGSDRTDRSH